MKYLDVAKLDAVDGEAFRAREPYPWVNPAEAREEYGIDLIHEPEKGAYDVVVIAVAHREFRELGANGIRALGKEPSVVYDIKYVLPADAVDDRL